MTLTMELHTHAHLCMRVYHLYAHGLTFFQNVLNTVLTECYLVQLHGNKTVFYRLFSKGIMIKSRFHTFSTFKN